jgi:GWxTD domain-containing protein
MKTRSSALLTAALLVLLALPCRAEVSKAYQDWAAGPVQLLMTQADRDAWSKVATDQDADAFVRLFWARRDPTPDTPENEFRKDFEFRAAYADQHFRETNGKGEEVRGSLTDRGRVFILLGPPHRLQKSRTAGVQAGETGDTTAGGEDIIKGESGAPGAGRNSDEIWMYEDEDKPAFVDKKRLQVRFRAEPGTDVYKLADPLAYVAEAVTRAIVRPDLQLADLTPATGSAAKGAGASFSAWGADVVTEPATVEALDKALSGEAAAGGGGGLDAHLDTGAFEASNGTWIVPVQVSTAGQAPAGAALVGEVVDADGARKLTFRGTEDWQTAKDQHVAKATVVAPPGSYQLRVGITNPAGEVLWRQATPVAVPATSDDFWLSEILLSDDIYPMKEAQQPLAPFAWEGVVVVPKGDRTFAQGDVMWYYLHACQPKLTADGKPNLRLTAQITGPVSFRGPMAVQPVKAGDRCWVLAQGLSLLPDHFPVGDYQLKVGVRDAEADQNLSAETGFKVTAAPGG